MTLERLQLTRNARIAKLFWPGIRPKALRNLRELTSRFQLSVEGGDIQLLNGQWYVTHSGLLKIAQDRGCCGIITDVQESLSEPSHDRWVFKATVYKSPRSKGFVGYGDANPGNVSIGVSGCEMRIAETRAVNRALRKAYGVGVCSVDELGLAVSTPTSGNNGQPKAADATVTQIPNDSGTLRDRLRILIKKHDLDAELVKRYAASFCGTATLRDANRNLVEVFIESLANQAESDRDGLICKLNGFASLSEVKQ